MFVGHFSWSQSFSEIVSQSNRAGARPIDCGWSLRLSRSNGRKFRMDVVAHGLWGGALFCRRGRKQFFGGLIVGMAPDLLSFGVFHVMHPRWILLRLAGGISGPQAFMFFAGYVLSPYIFTHVLLLW